MAFVDTHCHLDHHEDRSVAEQVASAHEAGVELLVTVGTSLASSNQAVATARRHADVWAAVGIHPNDAIEATPQVLAMIDQLAADDAVVAVGETGLDYYRDYTTPEQQADAFRAHIAIAKRHDRALVIHCRDAWDDTLAILDEVGAPNRVVMHCFSGDLAVTERCVDEGWFLSYAGNVTFKNADALRLSAAATPLDLLLTETDSPFLAPEPHRGRPNEPAYVVHTLERLAELLDVDAEDMAAAVEGNARRAFALPD
ncbi:MAG: TatD family hydrolase [Nitriliruptoraceae bacterium]